MAAVAICSDFGTQKDKVYHCLHCFPIYLPWSNGTRCHDPSFLNVEFEANFFTLLFHFHQRLFSSSLSAISVVSSTYLRLLIFHPHIWGYWYYWYWIKWQSWFQFVLIQTRFLMIYSAYKLNKQGNNTQPWCSPFPIWSQSVVPCPVLTVASWPA